MFKSNDMRQLFKVKLPDPALSEFCNYNGYGGLFKSLNQLSVS